jgi:hypothetical protein
VQYIGPTKANSPSAALTTWNCIIQIQKYVFKPDADDARQRPSRLPEKQVNDNDNRIYNNFFFQSFSDLYGQALESHLRGASMERSYHSKEIGVCSWKLLQ